MKRCLLSGVFLSLAGSIACAQVPVFTYNFYNPCGGDGSNEFLIGYVSGTQPFNPGDLYYFVSIANGTGTGTDSVYQDAFCGSAAATGNGSSACDAAGWTRTAWVGGASWRILDYANVADQPTVDNVVARLNAQQALCPGACGNTFIAPDAATGTIPAGADFIFCISSAINDSTTYSPDNLIDFCSLCANDSVYVIVASFPPGNTGLVVNTGTAGVSRYIALAYNFGAGGVSEIYSYVHTPPSSAGNTSNYYHVIPQGTAALTNTQAASVATPTCALAATALPVTISSFSGYRQGKAVLLQWTTRADDAGVFEVQESGDGTAFRGAGLVQGRTGLHNYEYRVDPAPDRGHYYRLKTVAPGEGTVFSRTVFVPGTTGAIHAFPNPAGDLLFVDDATRYSHLSLYTLSGSRAMSVPVTGAQRFRLDISRLLPACYILELTTIEGEKERQLLYKQ